MSKGNRKIKVSKVASGVNSDQNKRTVTVLVEINGKQREYAFIAKTDAEIERQIRKIKRKFRIFGGALIQLLIGRNKADSKLFNAVDKILKALDDIEESKDIDNEN